MTAKVLDVTVTGAFVTVLILPLFKIGSVTKQTTKEDLERSEFEFNFEEQMGSIKLTVGVDKSTWDVMKSELGQQASD